MRFQIAGRDLHAGEPGIGEERAKRALREAEPSIAEPLTRRVDGVAEWRNHVPVLFYQRRICTDITGAHSQHVQEQEVIGVILL